MKEKKPHKIRREREIARLKKDVLDATRELFRKKGWEKVSIRKIAEVIAYTPPVIYEHYKGGKPEILGELEKMGFALLRDNISEAYASTLSHPPSQIEAMSLAAWDFATKNPDLYQVMFNLEGIYCIPGGTHYLRDSATSLSEFIQSLPAYEGGREELFFSWWAMVHGFISLSMSGHTPNMKARLRGMLSATSRRFVVGLV